MNITEYYTLGSRSELEGLTLMTRIVNEETGEPVVQLGLPEQWYKPKKITKAAYDKLLLEFNSADANFGIAGGLINATGLRLLKKENTAIMATKEADCNRLADIHISYINKSIELGLLTEEGVDDYINSLSIDRGSKRAIKAKR